MMQKNQIANMALGILATSETITDIVSDFSIPGKILKRHYRESLNDILEQHPWDFARRTSQLVVQFENPEPGYAFSYYMPKDVLIIRQIARNGFFIKNLEVYRDMSNQFMEITEGTTRLIYTNVELAHAEYTKVMDENTLFPSHFGRAFAAQLAKDCAPSLITSNYPKIKQALMDDIDSRISRGIADDIARKPQLNNAESTFVRARYE